MKNLKGVVKLYFTAVIMLLFAITIMFFGCKGNKTIDYPDPLTNPSSKLMLEGDWLKDPHQIDFDELPKISLQHAVVSDVTPEGVNQHNYLAYYDNRYWLMWSDGPGVEDRAGQVVKYSTSTDGLNWEKPKFLTSYPEGSEPGSPHYNTRTDEGLRWISRGFWEYKGDFLALASLDEAAGFFGPSLSLHAFKWNKESQSWEPHGLVMENAINNFPPKRLPTGEWLMSRRSFDYVESGVDFMVGAEEHFNQWEVYPVFGTSTHLEAEEPYWWILPDNKNLMALFRDNRKSGYLYRSFSTDNGRTWSSPVQTNFPDARSKFHGLRLQDGRYVLVSNSNYKKRDPLTLAISEDGMVFTKMGYLVGGRHIDYPHVLEHNGYLLIAFAGDAKQKIEVVKVKVSDLDKITMD
ncbi:MULTISPECIES: exo-alpha-sialidase [Arenibacter]|uniref:exo-alpha-sialidase n=1 Tax=Arenibacter TaxID=178469 RepID=UPI000A3FB700|nr:MULTISPECIES: exo-alpha-sialidase [Arenibacter]